MPRRFSLEHLWAEFREFDVDERLVGFEASAHNPPFEEPAPFNRTLVEVLGAIRALGRHNQR